jgi:glycosyltransferase involved in cell wall biosynthesis
MTVQNLVKQGHEVLVATPGKNAPDEYYGAKVVKVPGFKFPLNEFCDSEYLDIYATYCIISTFKPDIVHVCSPTWIVFSVNFWCWWFGIPSVSCYHTHVPEYVRHYISGFFGTLLTSFMWFLVRMAQNSSDLTMVTSDIMGKELQQNGINNDLAVWRKGVDTELFHPGKASEDIRSRLMPDTSKVLLLYAGRLSLEKGLPFLAKVLEDNRIRGKVHLALIGDGPIRKDLEMKTFARVRNDVSFLGFMSQEELAYAYASSDIFVFPSETETLGLVAIEAMAGGLPVVGVAARGMTATVKHGETGFLYPIGDLNQCVTYLLTLIEDPEKRKEISRVARKDAEEWGWDKATRQLVGVYEETIEKCKTYKVKAL